MKMTISLSGRHRSFSFEALRCALLMGRAAYGIAFSRFGAAVSGRPRWLLGALAAALTLAACATYRPQPIEADRSLAAFEARRLDDRGLRHYMERALHRRISPWPPRSWDFQELTLAADFFRADLAAAQAKFAAANAAVVTAGARPNPTLAFSPSYDLSSEPGISPWTLGFTLDAPIETAGKRGYRIAQAQHLANAARLDVASVAWQVRSRLRSSLVQLQAAERGERILVRQLAADHQAVQLLEQRLNLGQASATEVQLVRIAATQAALQLEDARKQAAQARIAAAAAVGIPETALESTALSFTSLDSLPQPEQAAPSVRDALLNRPDVLAALADYEASESALQLEVARQYPDIQIGPGFSHGYTARELENSLTFGISLTLPILNRNQGPIAEAEARRQEAAANFNSVQAAAVAQVHEALAAYRASLAKLETAGRLLGEQRQRMGSTQALFDAGEANRLSLVEAQSELATDELTRMQAFTEAQVALGQLEDAMERAPRIRPIETDSKSGEADKHP